jgi:tRNA pseudouridine55 synthase
VEGRRAYEQARRAEPVALTPAPVRVSRAEILEINGPQVRVSLTCSAGFYVRSFAHALGESTGAGACLEALRRTRSGDFTLDAAVTLDRIDPERLIPLDRLLPRFPAVQVTPQGRRFVHHGRELRAADFVRRPGPAEEAYPSEADPASAWVRIMDDCGTLLALGTAGHTPGSLHPAVVLV